MGKIGGAHRCVIIKMGNFSIKSRNICNFRPLKSFVSNTPQGIKISDHSKRVKGNGQTIPDKQILSNE